MKTEENQNQTPSVVTSNRCIAWGCSVAAKKIERKYFVIYYKTRNSASLQKQAFLTKEYSFE